MLNIGLGSVGAGRGAPPPVEGVGVSDPYYIATNRFVMPGDWGTTDSTWATNTDTGKIDGGNGSVAGRYFFRRFYFRTAWAARSLRFLFQNSAMSIYGVRPSRFTITLQKAEIRTTGDVLVEALSFDGAAGVTLGATAADAEEVDWPSTIAWSDPLETELEADTGYWLEIYCTAPDNSSFPAIPSMFLPTECCAASASTNYGTGSRPATNLAFAPTGGHWGPTMAVAKGKPAGKPAGFIIGTSIADWNDVAAALATERGDTGYIGYGLGDPESEESWPYASAARFASNMQTVFQDAITDANAVALASFIKLATDALGQSEPVMNFVFDDHGRNNINAGFSQIKTALGDVVNAFRTHWPDLPVIQSTTPPYTTAGSNSAWTTEADQTAVTNNDNTGILRDWNDWLVGGADGVVDLVVDTAAVCRGTSYYAWKVSDLEGTLLDAVAANNTNIVRLDFDPGVGNMLVFEPGDATNVDFDRGYAVYSIEEDGVGEYEVTLREAKRASYANPAALTGASGNHRVQKAHSAGAVVKVIYTRDGLHPGAGLHLQMGEVVSAAKPDIAALVAAYEAA